jgi:hypothetical protein
MKSTIEIHDGAMPHNEFLQGYVKPGKPVLLKGAVKSSKAYRTWDMDYFRALDASKKLNVKYGNIGDGNVKTMDIRSYVNLLQREGAFASIPA